MAGEAYPTDPLYRYPWTNLTEAALRNASALLADEAEPASGAAGLIAKARGDYRRLLAALYGEGHYGGAVSIRIGGREASSLAPDTSLPDPVDVTIAVTAGPLFRFGDVVIVNQAAPTLEHVEVVQPGSEDSPQGPAPVEAGQAHELPRDQERTAAAYPRHTRPHASHL